MSCGCGKMYLGAEHVGTNWSPDCPQHGLESEWYLTVGKERFDEQNRKAVDLQLRARAARDRARGERMAQERD